MSLTVTTIFIVPTIGLARTKGANEPSDVGFINGYVCDSSREDIYKDCVYLLFKPTCMDKFRMFLEKEYEKGFIVDEYDYEGGYVVVVCKLRKEFKKDYALVRKGKYSDTSLEFQKLFPVKKEIIRNGSHFDELSLQWRIFRKDLTLVDFWKEKLGITLTQDQEFWSGFFPERETLDINKIKQEETV